jgi:hypothetical protein
MTLPWPDGTALMITSPSTHNCPENGAHTHQAGSLQGAPVQDGSMADDHAWSDFQSVELMGRMEGAVVLNIGVFPDVDMVDVTPDGGVAPHRSAPRDGHVAVDSRGGIDIDGGVDVRMLFKVGKAHF